MEDFTGQTDEQFRDALERCTIPNRAFRHRDHLRLAWVYLREANLDTAEQRLTESIRRFAHHHGSGHLYHDTLTRAWARIVALAIAETPTAGVFDELLAARPHLLDKNLPLKHYSSSVLWSGAARERWVEPDLRPFPG